jgi:hypothetical protein
MFMTLNFPKDSSDKIAFFTKPVSTETKDSSDKIASTEEPISKESLTERIDDSASSVLTV